MLHDDTATHSLGRVLGVGQVYLSGAHHARRVTAIRQEFRGPQA
jgi:hypothetical protein